MVDLVQILAGGLTGAFLNQVWTEVRGRWSERKDAKITALFIIAELDAYVAACARRRQDVINNETTDGEMGHPWRTIPEVPLFSDKTNWRAVGIKTTHKVMTLRATAASHNAELEGLWEIIDAEDVVNFASDYCVEIGVKAATLSEKLAAIFGIKPLDEGEWDAASYIRGQARVIEQKEEEKALRASLRVPSALP